MRQCGFPLDKCFHGLAPLYCCETSLKLYSHDEHNCRHKSCDLRRNSDPFAASIHKTGENSCYKRAFRRWSTRIPTVIWASVISRIRWHGPTWERLMYGDVVRNPHTRIAIWFTGRIQGYRGLHAN